jgi:serine/threonine protein kinase
MICAACGYEWDSNKSSCPRCGFHMPVTVQANQSGQLSFDERITKQSSRSQSGGLADVAGPSGNLARPLSPRAVRSASQPLTPPASSFFARQDVRAGGSGGEVARNASSLLPQAQGLVSPLRPVAAGTALRGGRYRVQELQSRQDWPGGAFEATWVGRDFQREMQVVIREVVIPGTTPEQVLPIMHVATTTLLSLQRYPHVAPILDAFKGEGRSFFVFGLVQGESLMDRLRHLQHPLPEQEVVDFCLQMTEVLETLSQKSLVHGAIRPEHVYRSYSGSRYILSNFSILVAGKGTKFVTGGASPSPYSAPEFAQGLIDVRSDIYAVLATAYHLVTGNVPSGNTTPSAQSVNPAVSPAFSAILAKGLHFSLQQRYQHPSQLRQDLLSIHSQVVSDRPALPVQRDIADSFPSLQDAPLFTARPGEAVLGSPYPFPVAPSVFEEKSVLLPSPETLPALRMGNEGIEAVFMLMAVVLILGVITVVSNFHL